MSKALATKNVAAVLVAVALVVGFAFAFATPAKADTLSTLQAQVQALLAQIAALQGGSSTGSTSSAGCYTFTRNHKVGESGGEVMWIQKFLNNHGFMVSASGAGSMGNETSYFGPATKKAVMAFQQANAADILTPVGLTSGTGNWGPSTRAKANAMCAGSMGSTGSTGSTGGTTVPTGPGITVMAGAQPANSLAPAGALRVPFTNVTITNNTGAAVTINGVVVQRTGLAQDNNFASIVLVDSMGLQLGNTQTLDSNHMATVGGSWTLAPGASMTYTVAGNISSSNAHAGEVASLTVTGVNTSVPVNGSLPIVGASQTINSTLSIGGITTGNSAFDPSVLSTKNLGSTGIKFTGVRFTANSNEDVKFISIRWRVNGSASAGDFGNLVTVVNGTSYPAVASADGRYYTSTFPGGILVTKGNSVDAYIQGDLVGTNAAGRVVEFDLDKTSDVYFVGQTYGYGVPLTLAGSCSSLSTASTHNTCHSTAGAALQPWLQGSTVSVQAGTVTTIQNASSVAAQNIPVNVPNTVLGGFTTNFAGEPVTVSGMNFYLSTAGTRDGITSVSLVDQNGAVVAGPVDSSGNVVTYSNSVTFPVGARTYTLKGKLASTFTSGQTVTASTTPSSWTSPTGQTSGNSITISTANFAMNVMTVRAGSLSITAAGTPASQNVVRPATNIVLANIQVDASASGEDMRISSLVLYNNGTAAQSHLSGCQVWDGATALTTGSNVVNTFTASSTTVTLDNSLTVAKGTVKNLAWSCNIDGTTDANSTIIFGVNGGTLTAYGVQSGASQTITEASASYSGTQTISSGATVTLGVDASSPSYALAAGGQTGVTVGVIKIRSANESYNLQKLGLVLTSGAAADLGTVHLYANNAEIGTATFTGSNTLATSTLATPLSVTRDTDVLVTVKADIGAIGVGMPATEGNLVKVDPKDAYGTGASSGSTVWVTGTAGVAGVRIVKSFPTIAMDTLPSTGVVDGRLIRFKVTADSHGPVGLWQFPFNVATSTVTNVTNVQLFGFTDSSYSQAISGQGSGGQIGSTASPTSTSQFFITPSTNPVQVPAATTYYFELRGTVAGVTTGSSVVAKLLGDTSSQGINTIASQTGNFFWSGNATTTSTSASGDWENGYSLPGLSSSGLIQARSN